MLLLTVITAMPLVPAESEPLTLGTLSIIVGACFATAAIAVTCALVIRNWVSDAKAVAYAIGKEITEKIDNLDEKERKRMTQHNREDDARFDYLNVQLWALRVRNAEKDKTLKPEFEGFPPRRHDYDDDSPPVDIKRAGLSPFPPGSLNRPEVDRPGAALLPDSDDGEERDER